MSNQPLLTTIEPPGLSLTAIGVDDPGGVEVVVSLREPDETVRTASVTVATRASDGDIAVALVRCLNGCAALRGPELVTALQRLVAIR